MQNSTQTNTSTRAPNPAPVFRAPTAVSEDLAFALMTGDTEILKGAVLRHRLSFDSFTSADFMRNNQSIDDDELALMREMPSMRITSIEGLDRHYGTPDVLLVLPAAEFTEADAVELLLRLLATGKAFPELGGVAVYTRSGAELVIFGAPDKSPDAEGSNCWVFAPHPDASRPAKIVSTAIH